MYCIETLFGKPKRLLCRAAALGGLILPFLLVPLYMAFAERGRTNAWIILSIFLPSPLIIEYSFLSVLLGIAWYFVHNKYLNCAIFSVFSLVCMAVPSSIFDSLPLACFTTPYCSFYQLFVSVQWLTVFCAGDAAAGRFWFLTGLCSSLSHDYHAFFLPECHPIPNDFLHSLAQQTNGIFFLFDLA